MKEKIARHRELVYVALSFLTILIIFANSSIFQLPYIGAIASIVYLLVNGNMIANSLFQHDRMKLPLGVLLLIAFMGIFGWLFIVFYRLRISEVTIVLFASSFLSIFITRIERIKFTFVKLRKKLLG